MKHQYKPLLLLSVMFLMVGALFCMNDILLPSLKTHFGLSYAQATLIQFSFYLTYIVFPFPIAWMIHRHGYKVSLLVSLIACTTGCALFLPAYWYDSYPIVLLGIFIISTGLTIINVAANPFATLLGDPEGAHQRINFVQVFSRIGYAATPLLATALIYDELGQIRYHVPYLLLAAFLFAIALLFRMSSLPSMKPEAEEAFSLKGIVNEAMAHPHLAFGVLAMFFYMGAEACTAGFFIPYLKSEMGLDDQQAAGYLTLYYILTAVMGMLAVVLLRFIKAHILTGLFAIGMIALYGICIAFHSDWNAVLLACLGLFLSVMFPTLFSLAIEDVGSFTGKGSALVNLALVGGSVFPPLQGLIADEYSVRISYIVPMFCFIMIMVYAFFFTREALLARRGKAL